MSGGKNVTDAWIKEQFEKEAKLTATIIERNKDRALSVVLDPIGVPALRPSRSRKEPIHKKEDPPIFLPPELEEAASVVGSASKYPKSAAGSKRSNLDDEVINQRLASLEVLLGEERRRSRAAEEELKCVLTKSKES